MFDLTFDTSVLDKMPVGTSFRHSDHEITKTREGWTCEDCSSVPPQGSSSAYMSDTSRKYALDKFAGAVIDPDDLDPRLLAFLPAGTRVADRDSLGNSRWHWHKTETGRWLWAHSREEAEASASNGLGHEDLDDYEGTRPFRLFSLGTAEPESDETPTDPARSYDIDELDLIDNKILLDHDGDRWVKVGDKWYILYSNGISGLPWGDHLNPSYGPYEIAEEFQELTAQQASTLKGKVLVDRDEDLWAFVDGNWSFKSGAGFTKLGGEDPFGSYGPLTLYHDQSVHPESSEAPKSDATPAVPGGLTAAEATAVRDAVYDNGGGKWVYTSEGGYRLTLGGNLLGTLREQLPADYAPYFTEDPRAKSAPEPEPVPERIPESETDLSAAEATNFKDCRFRDCHGDVWLFDRETYLWRYIRIDGTLSCLFQYENLTPSLEPYILVEGEISVEPESKPEPAEGTKLPAKEASDHKDTVFEDSDGDAWFFDDVLQRWRGIGPDWAYAKEELEALFSPYTSIGSLSEHERGWTAEEANRFKDETLEDRDGDIWLYDAPSQQWKCGSAAITNSDLDAYYQPYRIKKAAQGRTAAPGSAIFLGFDEPFHLSGDTEEPSPDSEASEEVTFEGSAKEAVELLDRIARSLESIDRKLGDK